MAKKDYTPYQKQVIKNYYKNKDHIQNQKLGEIIADLYLAETEAKRAALWNRVAKTLTHLNVHPKTVEYVVRERDIETLTEIATELF